MLPRIPTYEYTLFLTNFVLVNMDMYIIQWVSPPPIHAGTGLVQYFQLSGPFQQTLVTY
jgi:hypothetical protein